MAAVAETPSASPVARRTAQRLGVALAGVAGNGPFGRILKADVVVAAERAPAPPAAAPAPAAPSPAPVASAPATGPLPALALDVEVDLAAATALREQLAGLGDPAPDLVHLVAAAAARALRDDATAGVDVGVAVPQGDGVALAVVRGADAKSLSAIAAESREPGDGGGPALVVVDAGGLGVDRVAPVQAPAVALLTVGAVRALPTVEGTRPVVSLSLASTPGGAGLAGAARLLAAVRDLLEQPLRLAL
ncbi:MAG TPA: E3 binding domain-containing protein [Capillimicrobium sp.]|nr:E3 binding domain-containing protein [Capillimicrobium sp.]